MVETTVTVTTPLSEGEEEGLTESVDEGSNGLTEGVEEGLSGSTEDVEEGLINGPTEDGSRESGEEGLTARVEDGSVPERLEGVGSVGGVLERVALSPSN